MMATEYYETEHCGRIVISSAWNYCPFCGTCLHCESNLASEEMQGDVLRLRAFCCEQRLDRNLRAKPITGVMKRKKLARQHMEELKEMEK